MEEFRKYRFKEGDAVAHVNNLGKQLHVARIIKKKQKESYGKDGSGKEVVVSKEIMLGVECHWWEGKDEDAYLQKGRFHSAELVPWDIAVKKKQENEKTKIH